MGRPLEIAGCRALCAWHETGDRLDGEPLFACEGCGSEWVPSEPWTPVDHTGAVPEPVLAVRRRAGGSAPGPTSRGATSDVSEGHE